MVGFISQQADRRSRRARKESRAMKTATQILTKVEVGRLQKAVDGFVSEAYSITVTTQDDEEVRSFVINGDGHQYGVVLTEGQAFCSCPDAMYRKGICKHAVALALHVIRNPQAEAERKPDLTLRKVRSSEELARDRALRRLPSLPYEDLPY